MIQDHIQEAENKLENTSYAKKRYEICKKCEKFNNAIKVCGECLCFMPIKVQIERKSCPIGKWGKAA